MEVHDDRSLLALQGPEAVQVLRGDGVAVLRSQAPASLDLLLLDPPFDSALFEPAMAAAAQALSNTGCVYLEAPVRWSDERLQPFQLRLHRHLKAGAVHAHLLLRTD